MVVAVAPHRRPRGVGEVHPVALGGEGQPVADAHPVAHHRVRAVGIDAVQPTRVHALDDLLVHTAHPEAPGAVAASVVHAVVRHARLQIQPRRERPVGGVQPAGAVAHRHEQAPVAAQRHRSRLVGHRPDLLGPAGRIEPVDGLPLDVEPPQHPGLAVPHGALPEPATRPGHELGHVVPLLPAAVPPSTRPPECGTLACSGVDETVLAARAALPSLRPPPVRAAGGAQPGRAAPRPSRPRRPRDVTTTVGGHWRPSEPFDRQRYCRTQRPARPGGLDRGLPCTRRRST